MWKTPGYGLDGLSTPKYPYLNSSNFAMWKLCHIPKDNFLGHPVLYIVTWWVGESETYCHEMIVWRWETIIIQTCSTHVQHHCNIIMSHCHNTSLTSTSSCLEWSLYIDLDGLFYLYTVLCNATINRIENK